jgi:hypothetical protein
MTEEQGIDIVGAHVIPQGRRTFETIEQVAEAIWPRTQDDYWLRKTMAKLNEKPWCPKCGLRTSWRCRTEKGMCPRCYKIWTHPSFDAILNEINDEHRAVIASMEGVASVKIVSELRRRFGDIIPGVPWDVFWMLVAKR